MSYQMSKDDNIIRVKTKGVVKSKTGGEPRNTIDKMSYLE